MLIVEVRDGNTCPCSGKHVPAPMVLATLDRPDGTVVHLCFTAMANVMHLFSEYKGYGGPPPGSVTKHYGKLIRELAREIWKGSNV